MDRLPDRRDHILLLLQEEDIHNSAFSGDIPYYYFSARIRSLEELVYTQTEYGVGEDAAMEGNMEYGQGSPALWLWREYFLALLS